jgi:hypothetical protein
MKPGALAFLLVCLSSMPLRSEAPIFAADRPTVIAFSTITQEEVNDGSDVNEVLGDFQVYAGSMQKTSRKSGDRL